MSSYVPNEASEKREQPSIHVDHLCTHEGCKKWGAWGYETDKGTEWYCTHHRPADNR